MSLNLSFATQKSVVRVRSPPYLLSPFMEPRPTRERRGGPSGPGALCGGAEGRTGVREVSQGNDDYLKALSSSKRVSVRPLQDCCGNPLEELTLGLPSTSLAAWQCAPIGTAVDQLSVVIDERLPIACTSMRRRLPPLTPARVKNVRQDLEVLLTHAADRP